VQQFDTNTPADDADASQAEAFRTTGVGAPARRFFPPADQNVGRVFEGFDTNPQTGLPDTAGYPVEIPEPDDISLGPVLKAIAEDIQLREAAENARPSILVIDDPARPPLMADDISQPVSAEVPYDSVVNSDIPSDYIAQPIDLTPTPEPKPEKVYLPPPRFDVMKCDFAVFVQQRCEEIGRALGIGISRLRAAKDEFANLELRRAEITPLPEGWESVGTKMPPEPFKIDDKGQFVLTETADHNAACLLRVFMELMAKKSAESRKECEGLDTTERAGKVLAELMAIPDVGESLGVFLPALLLRRLAEQAATTQPAGEPIQLPAPNCRTVTLELHVRFSGLDRPDPDAPETEFPLYVISGCPIRIPGNDLQGLYALLDGMESEPQTRGLRGHIALLEDAMDDLADKAEVNLADDVADVESLTWSFADDEEVSPLGDIDSELVGEPVGACCGGGCKSQIPPIDLSNPATAAELSASVQAVRDNAVE
jgi:hypothetical protein